MFGQQSCSGFVSNQKKNLSCWMNKPRVPRHPPAPASFPGSLSAFLRFLWLQRQMQWEHMPGKWALEPVVQAHPQMRSELMLSCDYMRPSLETQRHFFMWQPNSQETPKSVERCWAPRLMVPLSFDCLGFTNLFPPVLSILLHSCNPANLGQLPSQEH